MKKVFLMFVSLLLLTGGVLWALPAKRISKVFTQPDGSTLTIVLQGDEHFHYYSTTDGIMLKESSDGYMKYATVNAGGILAESNYIAHNEEERNEQEKAYIKKLSIPEINNSIQKVKAENPMVKLPSGIRDSKFPSIGKVRGLIILAQYQDVKFSSVGSRDNIYRMMNEEGYSDSGATGSARDYFIDQSLGKFLPEFDVVGPVTLPQDMKYYGKNNSWGSDGKAIEMIADACTLVDDEVDFSLYDQDNDGKVDLVYVIYAGYAEAQGAPAETIWPHTSDFSLFKYEEYHGTKYNKFFLDNTQITVYACSSELHGDGKEEEAEKVLDGIGSFCHEYSHCLGLPDLYDTQYSGKTFGMDVWDIMDHGNYNNEARTPSGYSALERYHVGWLDLEELTEAQDGLSLEAINISNKAYVIKSDFNEKEFFTLENRQQTGWDKYLPGHGLMITHIDYDKNTWIDNHVNNTIEHERVQIMAADNLFSSKTVTGDLFPGPTGNMSFTDKSKPAATLYKGEYLGKTVSNIQENNGIITFDFLNIFSDAPVASAADGCTGNSFTAHWEPLENALSYDLEVTPASIGHITLAEDFSKFTAGSTTAPDVTDISGKLDEYTTTPGWTGLETYQAGGAAYLNTQTGYISTPSVDLSANKQYTVCISVLSNKTGFNALNLAFSRNQQGTLPINQKGFYITKGEKKYIWTVSTDEVKAYLNIQATIPVYIKSINIYSGDVSALLNNDEALTPLGGGEKLRFNGITTTHYDVMGLTSSGISDGPDYIYVVYGRNGEKVSASSNKIQAKLNPSSININEKTQNVFVSGNDIVINATKGETINLYSAEGLLKYSFRANEGQNRITVEKGLYIIQIASHSTKAVVSGK